MPIYIYLVDPARIPDGMKVWIDEWQVAVTMDEIKPDKVEIYKSSEVFKYFRNIEGQATVKLTLDS